MKKLLFVTLLMTSFSTTFAEKKEVSFSDKKTKVLEMLDKRIALLNEQKSCISAATKEEDFKACRSKFKSEHIEKRQKAKSKKDS